jgi:putative Mg2+ transporter-C (MgtC) family protein
MEDLAMDLFEGFDVRYAIGLVAAVVLGALIGLERQLRKHPAGFHTNALVALGAAAYVVAATLVGDPTGPARVAGQVVVGVGFVCAGLIWHERGAVRGINTAATVWCSCAVGVFAGFGLLAWAVLITVLVILANVILHTLEQRIGG